MHSVHKHRGNSFQPQNYKMRLKQRSLNWINYMQVKKILFTNAFFSWSLCLLNMFPSMVFPKHLYFSGLLTYNRHHSSWPFLECRSSKLYFKILWKYDDWSFSFHYFLKKWPILPGKYMQVLSISHKMADYLAFPLLLKLTNIPLTSWGNEMKFTEEIEKELI